MPKNILFISADQWRAECLSALGHLVNTPNLDALAADGVLFRQHYSQAAPCGPARASLLTGLYAMNHRSILNGTPLDARHSNIALQVRAAGYDPIVFGYTDSSPDPRQYAPNAPDLRDYGGLLPGFREGFRYDQEICRPWLAALRRKGYSLPPNPMDAYLPDSLQIGSRDGHSIHPTLYRAEDSDSAYTTDRVLDYLDQQPPGWFVHAVYLRPHPPLYAPEPYNRLYDAASVSLPTRPCERAVEQAQHPFLNYWLKKQQKPGAYTGHPINVVDAPEQEIRQLRATYYGLITEVDAQIGRLIDYLKSSGQYEQTLIVFTVDHGEQLGDHWLWGKGGFYEQSYHIPLIIRAPDDALPRGVIQDAFTEAVDIMPTLLEWLAITPPRACDGRSLWPLLRNKTPKQWRDFVWWEYDFRDPQHQQAERALKLASDDCNLSVLRTQRYKYVHFTALPPLLFDLEQDPQESHNVANDRAYQAVQLEMAQRMLSHRQRHAERTHSNTLLTPEGVLYR